MNRTPIVLLLACVLALTFPAPALAQPADVAPDLAFENVPTSIGNDENPPIRLGFTTGDAQWISLGIRVFNREGAALFYESAWIGRTPAGRSTHDIDMKLHERDLAPGLYRVAAEISIRTGGETIKSNAEMPLAIWDPTLPPVQVAMFARIPTTIMMGPDETFLTDPRVETLSRDALTAIATSVSTTESARATIALAPVVLDEWRRIAQGYRFASPNGTVEVAADDTAAHEYDIALGRVRQLATDGRIELSSLGYSDPDLGTLIKAGLPTDIAIQYSAGNATLDSIISTFTLSGTMTPKRDLPVEADKVLLDKGLHWALVDSSLASRNGDTVASGAYPLDREPRITGLVTDPDATAALETGDIDELISMALSRQDSGGGSLIVSTDVTSTAGASHVSRAIEALSTTGGIRMVTADGLKAADDAERIDVAVPLDDTPSDHVAAIRTARINARALSEIALEPNQQEPIAARRASLMAESSAWRGTDGSWSGLERGQVWLDAARAIADPVVGALSLKIEPVTLSKDEGEIPVVVHNNTQLTLTVNLEATSDEEIVVAEGSRDATLTLRPNDNYSTIPVTVRPGATGDLTVKVKGGDLTLAEQTVAVRGSLLDRIVMLAGIVVVLLGLLLFVRRRVRLADAQRTGNGEPDSTSTLRDSADVTNGIDKEA